MDDLFEMISRMAPEEALSKMTQIMESLMADLDQDGRDRFLTNLIGQFEGDKVSSLVHL
jgi:flagellin-specific chaperone FliS